MLHVKLPEKEGKNVHLESEPHSIMVCYWLCRFFFAISAWASPGPYTITDLGTLGGADSRAFSLNDSGQVAGWAFVSGGLGNGVSHAFRYTGGSMTDLGTLGGTNSGAYGINSAGYVAGASWTTSDPNNMGRHAFLYDGTNMNDLGTLGGSESGAYMVNVNNKVVGWANNAAGQYRAFMYDHSSKSMSDLGALPTGTVSCAQGVNDNDEVVGYSGVNSDLDYHAFLHSSGSMTDLGTLGGTNSQAWSINNNGVIVGSSDVAGGGTHPFVYSNGVITDLVSTMPVPTGTNEAYGINDSGDIVGTLLGGTNYYGFIHTGSNIYDVNSLLTSNPGGWNVWSIFDINNNGQMVGYAFNSQNQSHAVLLTPVPEPAMLGLLALGGLTLLRRRRSA